MTRTEAVKEAAEEAKEICSDLPSDTVNPSTFIRLFDALLDSKQVNGTPKDNEEK